MFQIPMLQVNYWNYFRHPWLLDEQLYSVFFDYANLRSQLLPHLYTCAYQAHTSGVPILRPLPLEFSDLPEVSNCLNDFCLGRELLVTAFSRQVYLPAGRWLDFWTKKVFSGPGLIN
ncbi:MAG TPA: glycoside hydrolase family 31 protein [bacterium]|nr:glycoside hydrolase family 31 protein [bacterium]HOL65849.1 glycoside hydrolase family 31 protein [bacterium]